MMKTYFTLYWKNIKSYSCFFLCLFIIFSLAGCKASEKKLPIIVKEESEEQDFSDSVVKPTEVPISTEIEAEVISSEVYSWINISGQTLGTRVNTPAGFARIPSVPEELTGFLRGLTLKDAGSEVLLYDGLAKAYQDGHIAVFDLEVGERDLQQCADSIMRVYAEYYWSIRAYDKIAFHLTNGFLMEYTKWRDGNRIVVDGNKVSWSKTKAYYDSYEEFRKYLNIVFAYAGTLSLSEECEPVALDEMRPGDMFLKGGSPGHCVMVVDISQDREGNRAYLLAQGYMPAQDFHILKNPLHPEDPWYYASEITYPLKTPLWSFDENSLVRWSNFPLNEANEPIAYLESYNTEAPSDTDTVPAMSEVIITPTPKEASQVTLLAVGDNLIHIQVVESGKKEDGTYNYDHLYANLKDEISAADIAIINQETILGGTDFAYSGYPNFNSPTEIGDAIVNAGFDVVLHATNHTMDKGLKGVMNTFNFWKQYPQIAIVGINETEEERDQITLIEKNGIKLALLNYTYSLNGYSLPEDKPYLVNMLDQEQMSEDIKKAEEIADFTIVFPHWGTEYVYKATKTQIALTEFFYELGVDLVIGTHPHVIEPVEWIETENDHRMLVYYSLGNFMSYQKEAPRMLGGISNITITKDDSGTYISDSSITPIVTHYENGLSDYNYTIYKLSDYTDALAQLHGVSDLASNGPISYQSTLELANQVLGTWIK
jgi:poly-gamma-glutamate synthesis protein (capsule biosynthesis protein)